MRWNPSSTWPVGLPETDAMTVEAPPKKPGPALWLSLTVMGVALVLGVVSVVMFARPFVKTFADSPRFTTPGQFDVHLGKGTYLVYDRFGSGLQPAEVSVEAPSGEQLSIDTPSDTETIKRGGSDYTGAVRFHTPSSGTFTVQVRRGVPSEVIVARSFGDTFHRALPWLPSMLIGGIGFLAGIIMLIVGIVRRHSKRAQPAYGYGYPAPSAAPATTPATPPAGW